MHGDGRVDGTGLETSACELHCLRVGHDGRHGDALRAREGTTICSIKTVKVKKLWGKAEGERVLKGYVHTYQPFVLSRREPHHPTCVRNLSQNAQASLHAVASDGLDPIHVQVARDDPLVDCEFGI